MIEEINESSEKDKKLSDEDKKLIELLKKINTEPRYRHRYNEISIGSEQFFASRSCNCYGTGIYCWIPGDYNKGTLRTAVKCSCLIKKGEQYNAKKT